MRSFFLFEMGIFLRITARRRKNKWAGSVKKGNYCGKNGLQNFFWCDKIIVSVKNEVNT